MNPYFDSYARYVDILAREGEEAAERYLRAAHPNMSADDLERRAAQAFDPVEDAQRRLSAGGGSALGDFARMAAQGATLGFADELAGLGAALVPGGRGYREAAEASRQRVEDLRLLAPGASAASEIAGGLAAGAGTVGAATRAGRLGQVGRAAAARPFVGSAAAGALTGAGEGQGLGGRAMGAGVGGALGGVLGGVGSMVGSGLTSALTPARTRAARLLNRQMQRGGVGPEDLQKSIEAAVPGQTVMDVGGLGVEKLALGVQTIGSEPLDEFLISRTQQMPSRVRDLVQEGTGIEFGDSEAFVQSMIASRKAAADPLYEEAYNRAPGVPRLIEYDLIEDVMEFPEFREAYNRGVRLGRLERNPLPSLEQLEEYEVVPVRALDYMKRGLDDMTMDIQSGMRGGLAKAARKRLAEVLERVDEAVPEYKAARAQYKDDSSLIEAFNAGRKDYQKSTPSQLSAAMREMTEGERELYRQGVMETIRNRLDRLASGGNTSDATKAIINAKNDRDKMRVVFGEEVADELMNALRVQQRMMQLGSRITGGSNTAPRQEAAQILGQETVDIPTSGPQVARRAANLAQQAVLGARRRANADAVTPLLTQELFGGGGATLLEKLAAAQFGPTAAARRFGAAARPAMMYQGYTQGQQMMNR